MASKTTRNSGKQKASAALHWSAVDRPPAKRWWWYAGLFFLTVYVGMILALFRQWTGLALLLTVTVAIVVVYRWKPRKVAVTLDAETLVVNGQTFPLNNFRSFGIEGEAEQACIMLVPKKRLALPVLLAPSGNDSTDTKILSLLETHLPFVEIQPGVFDRMARWLRLG